jgi:AcrR family transcriptional regulator
LIQETEKTEAATGRMSGDERRSQILQIAIGLFSKKGFSGTTTKEIARVAGVSEAMVFRHFATKEELYSAILDYKACEGGMRILPWEKDIVEKRAIEENDDYNVFYNLAINALEHQQNDVDFMRLLFHSALEGHELSQMFFERFISRLYEFLSAYILKRQEAGAMREIEPRVVVRAFLGMIIHHSLNNILWDKSRRLLDISNEEAAREFATILLRGVLK